MSGLGFFNVLLYSFIAGMSTVAGVYLVKYFGVWTRRNSLNLISFAGGVLLATAFFELFPEALDLNRNWFYAAVIGVTALFLIEHFMVVHACHEDVCDVHTMGVVGALGIGIHSLIDGIVIGIGFEASFALGVVTSMAVIVHELPEGVFTYTLLIADEVSERKSLIYSWIVALATPFGAVMTYLILRGLSPGVLGIMLALAGGTFIYVGAADLLPQVHRKPNALNAFLVIVGILFVLIVGRFVGG
ncbi:MAG: ZIP family metal transporter [Actinomycetota bacterium]